MKIYMIVGSCAHYTADYKMWNVRVYTDQNRAKRFVRKLQAIIRKHVAFHRTTVDLANPLRLTPHVENEELIRIMSKHDTKFETDWPGSSNYPCTSYRIEIMELDRED